MEEVYKKTVDTYKTLVNIIEHKLGMEMLSNLSKKINNDFSEVQNHLSNILKDKNTKPLKPLENNNQNIINYLKETLEKMKLSKNPSFQEITEKIRTGEMAIKYEKTLKMQSLNNKTYYT